MVAVNRTRIFALADVLEHNTAKSCWVVHDNKIYDVTEFLADHPGGDDLIAEHAGKDVTSLMADITSHEHSKAAYELLQDYQIGVVGAEESITNVDFVWEDHFKPEDTDIGGDFSKNQFLDLNRALLPQMWNSNFSKRFYLQQVHQPRHLPYSAPLFGPWYLEMFSVTPWYVVPLIWLPIALYLFYQAMAVWMSKGHDIEAAFTRTLPCFFLGNFIWTLLEYIMHRFLFHIDEMLPDNRVAITLHFLAHGIHHYLPMDRLRLVMPPALFTALQFPFTQLAYFLFPVQIANGIIAGAFFFYVGYDVVHYSLHHTKLPEYIKQLKSHHMHHHYKEPDLGFGVTSWFWDWVFDTEFVSQRSSTSMKSL